MADNTISQKDLDILSAVNFYDCLTIKQVQRIFALKSYPKISERLARLVEIGKNERKSGVLEHKNLLHPRGGGVTRLYKSLFGYSRQG